MTEAHPGNVLIVGGGGREHALAWAAARSASVNAVHVAPGNPGTAREGGKVRNAEVAADDFEALADFAERHAVGLTLVGPEAPLAAGIRDCFDARGLACFGPTRAAAQLESSKSFAKDFMARHGIPTAAYRVFDALAPAQDHVRSVGAPLVVKADGLAAGKGVVVARDVDAALAAVHDALGGERFGAAGRKVVIEEFLDGEEASFICLADGVRAVPLASSQDHKARDEGDAGPNTGGMGAYSPAPVVTPAARARILAEIVRPTLAGMASEGMPYQGFLYVGAMVRPDGAVRVVEFNCRFGDPEAQAVLMRLRSDFADVCRRAAAGDLRGVRLDWDPRPALGVVLAAEGYPAAYRRGIPIAGLDAEIPNTKVFHAGTSADAEGRIRTSGGRVLCVVGLGEDVRDARRRAYARAERIRWEGMQYRRDIGHRALARADAQAAG